MKAIALALCLPLCGCASMAVSNKASNKDFNAKGELVEPNPAYYALMPFAAVFDIATFPLQMIWLGAHL